MKVVILAGGFGTRLSEETDLKPKPMVEIGGKPILWHIMKMYSHYGFNEFIICLGYKGYMIKEWFNNYYLHNSNVTIKTRDNQLIVHNTKSENWTVSLIDTGLNTQTGGRIKRIKQYLDGDNTFMLTYGDGLSNINIKQLVDFHYKTGKFATMSVVKPPIRFGAVKVDAFLVSSFKEKPISDNNWINGGFFVLEKEVLDYIENDASIWERNPLETLVKDKELAAFNHAGFWLGMDHLRDKRKLEELWNTNKAEWKVWKE